MSLRSILLTGLVIAGVWYWLRSRELKDVALRAASKYCASLDLELLDQTVVFRGLGLQREASGSLRIRRRYHFDFTSTGEDRYQGELVLLGRKVEKISLQPHRID